MSVISKQKNQNRVPGVYYRVSTASQDFDSQRGAVLAWLAGRPHKVFTDVFSAKKDNRPGYLALLAACARGEISDVVVYRMDRFHRTSLLAIRTILDLEASGAKMDKFDESKLK